MEVTESKITVVRSNWGNHLYVARHREELGIVYILYLEDYPIVKAGKRIRWSVVPVLEFNRDFVQVPMGNLLYA